jgi:signal transduction histidine kinase
VKYFLTILIGFLFCAHTPAQSLVFKHYNRASGLPSDYIFDIFQDKQGFIWFATDNGVCRYDGKQYTRYTSNDGLGANLVYRIFQDSKGWLWFGTYEGGVSSYDGEKFTNYSLANGQRNFSVMAIGEDRFGNMYFSGDYGLTVKRKKSWLSLRNKVSVHGQSRMTATNNGDLLLAFEGKMQRLRAIAADSFRLESLPLDSGNISAYDQYYKAGHNKYWVRNVAGIRLLTLDNQNNKRVETVSRDWVAGLAILHDSSIVVCGDLKGFIKKYDKKGKLLNTWQTEHTFSTIASDYEGNIWLGTFGKGVYKLQASHIDYQSQADYKEPIQALYEDSDKRLWVGTQKRFYALADTNIVCKSSNNDYFHVRAFAQNSQKQYYFGTLAQMFSSLSLTQMCQDKKLMANHLKVSGVSDMIAMPSDEIWISTYGEGIHVIDKNGKKRAIDRSKGLVSNMIEGLYACDEQCVWAMSRSEGVSRISEQGIVNYNKREGLPSDNVSCVYVHKSGNVWIATDKGVVLLFPDGKMKLVPIVNEKLSDIKILYIFEDVRGRLFFLSDKKLYALEGQTLRAAGSFLLLPNPEASVNKAYYQRQSNRLYLGTTEGLVAINMSAFSFNEIPPMAKIMQLKTHNQLYINPQDLELSYTQQNISIKFAALSYTDESQNMYRYTLHSEDQEGENKDSVYTQNNSIDLQGLAWGSYTFEVAAINPDGIVSAKPAVLHFVITPPFWATWWFRGTVASLLVLMIAMLARYLSNRKLKRQLAALELQHKLQNERERISRDLHDNVGSQLTYIISSLDLSKRRPNEAISVEEKQRLASLAQFARHTMGNLREAIWILQKDATTLQDFSSKLQRYVQQQIESQPQMHADFSFKVDGSQELSPVQALHLFRIGQEAINNAIKHANATQLSVVLELENTMLWLSISDNGEGISKEARSDSYGLQNMNKRAQEMNGRCAIKSKKPNGTVVEISVPMA